MEIKVPRVPIGPLHSKQCLTLLRTNSITTRVPQADRLGAVYIYFQIEFANCCLPIKRAEVNDLMQLKSSWRVMNDYRL